MRAALAVHAVMLGGAVRVVDALVGRRSAQARLARLVRGALRVRAAPAVADGVDAVVAIATVTVHPAASTRIRRRRRRRGRRRRWASASIGRRLRAPIRPGPGVATVRPGVGPTVRRGLGPGIAVVVVAARAIAAAVRVLVAGPAAHAIDAGLLRAAVPARGTPLGVRGDIATGAVAAVLVGVTVCGVLADVILVLAPVSVIRVSALDDASRREGECDEGHQPGQAGGGVRHGALRTRRSGQPSSV
jgi:hypothetical protein